MKKLLIVLAVLALAVPAGAQIYKNGQAPAAVTTCSDPLPLAQITDSGTANLPLLSGGGAGNPNYALLPVASLVDGTAGYFLAGGGVGDPAWTAPTWVLLQGSTPGSVQTGNLNLSGTVVCTTAKAPAGAGGAPGTALAVAGGAGGTAATDSDGQAGGAVGLTGGAGTALNGTGTNDGSGGDVILAGGAKGGATGNAVDGIVRVGTPTVASPRATNLLAVGGVLEVDGLARFDGGISSGTSAGISATLTVRDSGGLADCTMTFTSGLLTASTCTGHP